MQFEERRRVPMCSVSGWCYLYDMFHTRTLLLGSFFLTLMLYGAVYVAKNHRNAYD